MIAVFTEFEREFAQNFSFKPSNMFTRIRTGNDLLGRKFTGVMVYLNIHRADEHIKHAYDILKIRQPELFKPLK